MLHRANRFFNLVGRTVDADELRARVEVLAESDVFGRVPKSELAVLATMFTRRELSMGEVLCTQGDKATCAYAIASGEIEVWQDGATSPVARMRRGETLGEYGLFVQTGRTATLLAVERASVLVLEYGHFQRFLLAFPESLMSLMGVTVRRAHGAKV
jgi:NTE family protein